VPGRRRGGALIVDLAPFKELIKRRAGIDIRGPAERSLEDSLRERIGASGGADDHNYYLRLLGDEGEFFSLVESVAINETYFCRDCPQLLFFAHDIVPRLLAEGRTRPLRILSAGCSSGEEVYSIAMTLSECFGAESSRLFTIIGCDIDSKALELALAGVYRPFSFRGLEAERRKRWFDEAGDSRWRIKGELAAMTEFRRINLIGNEWPAKFSDFDAIFFRNVSIYFDVETRRKIQLRLASILRSDGYLITGSAETLANDLGVFELRSEGDNFYFVPRGLHDATSEVSAKSGSAGYKVLGATAAKPRAAAPRAAPPPKRADEVHGRRGAKIGSAMPVPSIEDLQALVVAKRYDEVLQVTESIASTEGPAATEAGPNRKVSRAEAFALLRSFVLFERQRAEEAESLALSVLESDPWSSDACVLLGLSKRRQGLREDAIDWFRKAAYANRACWPAHYYLAELYREQGERGKAGREYTIVLRALETQASRDAGLSVVPLGLPAGDIKMVCERRLAERVE